MIKSELLFDPYITIGEILDGFYNFRSRLTWDDFLQSGTLTSQLFDDGVLPI